MPNNRAPKCNGFNPNFTLSARTCIRYKIDSVFVDLPAKDWGEPKRLAEAAARVHGRVDDVSKIRNSIIRSLKDLVMQHTQQMSIEKYSSDCRDHLKGYSLGQFKDDYIAIVRQQEELKLRQQNEQLKRIVHLKSDNLAISMVNDSLDSFGNTENGTTRPPDPTRLEPSEKPETEPETEDEMTTEEKEEKDIWSRLRISAEQILAKIKSGEEISVSDRKIMSSGISCILDLVDLNPDGQAAIFGDEFENIKAKNLTRYKMQMTSIMPELTLQIISMVKSGYSG
ncbi:hypothetical protein BJV82DRAFT_61316 [Fennellomyces sp. T-0311]|nr:hypothetical protein BJV82DRAFT_61316 [Fennellomyces sp. T-0311]